MRHFLCSLALLGCACSASFDPKTGGADGTGSDFPNNGGSGSGTDGGGDDDGSDAGSGAGSGNIDDLDDIKSDMVTGADGCQTIDEVSHPGAASYFYGELEPVNTDDGPQWRGVEEWILFANEAWRDTGVSDCVVTWVLQAEEVDPGLCGACDVSLAVVGTVDTARTSCPDGLWEDSFNYSVQYDVRFDPTTDTSQWFFAESGSTMGSGSYAGVAMNYLTARSCVWF
jgi:hypothetical protein